MMKILLPGLVFLVVFLAAAIPGCTEFVPGPEVTAPFADEYAADDNTVVNVVNSNGRIFVNSWEGDTITLNAVKKTRFGAEKLDTVEITGTRSGNELTIQAASVSAIPPKVTVDMNISVPANVIVDSVVTSNGEIEISGTKGDTSASCSNGGINMNNVDGYVSARVSNGNINVRNTTGVGEGGLEITNGNIVADIFDIANDVTIQNTNGKITAFISPSLDANIDMRTTNGIISVNNVGLTITGTDDKTYMEGVLGEGGAMLSIVNTNGDVEVYGV